MGKVKRSIVNANFRKLVDETPARREAKLRRDTQLDFLDHEIKKLETRIALNEANKPRTGPQPGAPDGLYLHVSDRDEDLVLLEMRRKLKELRDSIEFNGALS